MTPANELGEQVFIPKLTSRQTNNTPRTEIPIARTQSHDLLWTVKAAAATAVVLCAMLVAWFVLPADIG